MRLKSIDIQGFKSFPDRTRLDFDDGITAVIGPNGSGKSNIADAMRWVMGEQSTRTLRGGKMEDVIFGGTQQRKPQGVASVTLLMDNSDRSLPIDSDEVAVTRRLYRSGDSEYRINGAQVRLKDVNELFMDTGLGRDGYSIIGQGRVAEIVSVRSKERREIFEEAAGISRFRYRKTEAERQLAAAEDNLSRLRDILSELESRVGPLKAQSEKAQRFLELASQKKTLEVSFWVHSLGELRRKTAVLSDKLLLAQGEHDAAERQAAEFERQSGEEQQRTRELTVAIEEKRAETAALSQKANDCRAQIAVLRNDIGHHERALEEANEAIGQAGRSREETEAQLAEKRNVAASQRQGAGQLKASFDGLNAQLAALEQQQTQQAEALDALRRRRTGVFEAIENAKLQAAASATRLGESESRLGEMDFVKQQRAEAVETFERELDECDALLEEIDDSLQSLDNSEKGYLLKAQSRRGKVEESERKCAETERKIQELESRARLLSEMDRNMEGFGPSVKYIINQSRGGMLRGVHGPVSSLLRVSDSHAVAIETALGGALQNIVVENEETAKRAISMLKSSKAGRATFLPLTAVKGTTMDVSRISSAPGFVGLASELVEADVRYAGIVNWLLGRIVVSSDLDSAVQLAKDNGYRFRVVTLDGQVVNAGGSMTGGFTSRSAGILGRQGEIDRLNAQTRTLAEQLAQQREKLAAERQELASLDAELDVIAARRKTYEEDRIRCEAERSKTLQSLEEAKRQLTGVEEEKRALEQRIAEMRAQSGGADELSRRLSAELDTLQQQIDEGGRRRDELVRRREELTTRLAEQNTHVMLMEREIAAAEAEIERIAAMLESNEQARAGLAARVEGLRGEIAEAEARIAELEQEAKDAEEAGKGSNDRIAALISLRNESERQTTELRAAEREAAGRRDGLYRELVRLGEQKNALDGELGATVAKLYDEYELTQSDAEEIAEPLDDPHRAQRQLSELRNKIRSLGNVNVGAIEEYAEVSARYEELSRQFTDVENSKTELTRLIGELTSRMCGIFTDKFEQISRNFSKVFHTLFEGGSASLSLTDPGDVLESGIEITVHPPGKVVKNLAALSGGEQSFVAIAIFFAILKVNPSPFCLMDEIEAALDDVNVTKFADYLRTMTDKTQFIAITHRRGTMEEADVLYGVTMQEKGVSKLLELKVSELEKSFGVKE